MSERSRNILIGALGGEGGGVLADWIIAAAHLAGLPVQSTSIPGVAQRTGATTYYLEIFPRAAKGAGLPPVLALTPTPGDIDVVVASELVEAGRALQNGYVTPKRTVLIASTNRVFAIAERSAMADGRFDSDRIVAAADKLARHAILFDMASVARAAGCPVNAVMFGALIASGVLPLECALAEQAIRASGKSVDANLKGFAAGFAQAGKPVAANVPGASRAPAAESVHPLVVDMRAHFPPALHDTIGHGLNRLVDYQGEAYASLFLHRLIPVFRLNRTTDGDLSLTRETARFLALWMSYEDVIRVADLKIRDDRMARVRREVRAGEREVVRIVEFLKPGLDELCSILPPRLGGALFRRATARGWQDSLNVGIYVRSTGILGFTLLRSLAGLRWWRPHSWRFAEEQKRIELWLDAVVRAAARDVALAQEIAACGQIVKGYGDTHRRALRHFNLIADTYFGVDPGHARSSTAALAEAVRRARVAALADAEGAALQTEITGVPSAIIDKTQPRMAETRH